jgi:hypothetical protein
MEVSFLVLVLLLVQREAWAQLHDLWQIGGGLTVRSQRWRVRGIGNNVYTRQW